MKIFENNLSNNPKSINLKIKRDSIGQGKDLPSYSKEWKDTVYSFSKDKLGNVPLVRMNSNKVIQSYFETFFRDFKYVDAKKYILVRRRRRFLRKIFVSSPEIKHANNKAIITLYVINREKKVLQRKYLQTAKKINRKLIQHFISLYNENLINIFILLNKSKKYIFMPRIIRKKQYLKYKFQYLNKFILLKYYSIRRIWGFLTNRYLTSYIKYLRRYDLLYSLNRFKFNKYLLLPRLNNVVRKILKKNIHFNIINLKSVGYNSDIFINILGSKLRKKRLAVIRNMFALLGKVKLPRVNTIRERSSHKLQITYLNLLNEYKDLRIISYLKNNINTSIPGYSNTMTLKNAYDKNKDIYKTIFNALHYKNMAGMRLEVAGRLTKRYRADRARSYLRWKGGLKNINTSFKGLSSPLYRGNSKPNTTYSIYNSKRRIGAFAIKGWIAGK
jgi:hypothetical protein